MLKVGEPAAPGAVRGAGAAPVGGGRSARKPPQSHACGRGCDEAAEHLITKAMNPKVFYDSGYSINASVI